MARVTYVKKARKDQRPCTKCRKPIQKGDSYKWFANRIGRYSQRKNFCSSCQIRSSDRTTSSKLATIYGAMENVEDFFSTDSWTRDDASQALRDAAEQIREVGDEYEESADAIEEGFQHATYQSDELREKAESVRSFADEIEQMADEIDYEEDPDADEDDILALTDFDPEDFEDEDDRAEARANAIEDKRQELREAIQSKADDALSGCPV